MTCSAADRSVSPGGRGWETAADPVDVPPGALPRLRDWFAERLAAVEYSIREVPVDRIRGWRLHDRTGDLEHESGRFFAVRGLHVADDGAGRSWTQAVLDQPETGILGLLVAPVRGVWHALVQAKMEPGNPGALQLSPTVQATRSNYTRVHGGAPVAYLEHFTRPASGSVLVDALHSEHGGVFFRKRNRSVVVRLPAPVDALPDFHWLPLPLLRRLVGVDHLVNMDTRSLLACLPPALLGSGSGAAPSGLASCLRGAASAATRLDPGPLRWLAALRAAAPPAVRPVPLARVPQRPVGGRLVFDAGQRSAAVLGVEVTAASRETRSWSQPLLSLGGDGLTAFLVRRRADRVEALVHARREAGCRDTAELAPTVQAGFDLDPRPPESPFLDAVLAAPADRVRYQVRHSEEGGRFSHVSSRQLIVEVAGDEPGSLPEDHRWIDVAQLLELSRRGGPVNLQTRSLLAGLHSLW